MGQDIRILQAGNEAKITLAAMRGFEPITYDHFNNELGKWIFKTADKTNLTHFRHKKTGKIYDSRQHKRMLNYHLKNLPY